jgi:hypothetical protein
LAATMFGAGCGSNDSMPDNAPAVTGKQMDGQTLYRGLFFHDGPASNLFDGWGPSSIPTSSATNAAFAAGKMHDLASAYRAQRWDVTASNLDTMADAISRGEITLGQGAKAQNDAFIQFAMKALDAQDSTFFTRFSDAMASGSQVKVQRAVAEGSRRLLALVASVGAAQVRKNDTGSVGTRNTGGGGGSGSGGGSSGSGGSGDGMGDGNNTGLDPSGGNGDDPGNGQGIVALVIDNGIVLQTQNTNIVVDTQNGTILFKILAGGQFAGGGSLGSSREIDRLTKELCPRRA